MSVEDFYRRSKGKFLKKILPIVKSRETAEDLVQDAIIDALCRYKNYDPSRSKEETWFTYILFNKVWDWKRKQKRQIEIDPTPIEDFLDLAQAVDSEYLLQQLDLSEIDNPTHKFIAELYFKKGYTYKEIQLLIKANEETLKKTVQRLRKRI